MTNPKWFVYSCNGLPTIGLSINPNDQNIMSQMGRPSSTKSTTGETEVLFLHLPGRHTAFFDPRNSSTIESSDLGV